MTAPLVIEGPGIRTESEANPRRAGNWWEHARRAKAQRAAVCALVRVRNRPPLPLPLDVTLTRHAPSAGLDDDNLRGALKHVRDGVADALGLPSDRDPRVSWHYHQARGDWGVRVALAPRPEPPALDLVVIDGAELAPGDASLRALAEVLLRLRPSVAGGRLHVLVTRGPR